MGIIEHIAASGLSRHEISKRARISRGMLSMIERGDRKPGPEAAQRLAAVLNVSPAQIRPDLAAFAVGLETETGRVA